jgi:hypothetical protein
VVKIWQKYRAPYRKMQVAFHTIGSDIRKATISTTHTFVSMAMISIFSHFIVLYTPQQHKERHFCSSALLWQQWHANERSVYAVRTLRVCGPGSVVGIATGYGLDGPGIESRWRRDFQHLSRPALGPTQPPVQWVPGPSQGKERPGRDADPSPPSSPVVMKE